MAAIDTSNNFTEEADYGEAVDSPMKGLEQPSTEAVGMEESPEASPVYGAKAKARAKGPEKPSTQANEAKGPEKPSTQAVGLEDFLGDWRDSSGNQVHVRWARQRNRAGELDVELLRPCSNKIVRLNVKSLGQGQFQCGHFELNVDKSSLDKIIWADLRTKGKVSTWEREVGNGSNRSGSRSRSPKRRPQRCGCVVMGNVILRCKEHLPLLPPRSVLHDISTPGAWAPPATAPEIETKQPEAPPKVETKTAKVPEVVPKHAEVDRLLEAYDQSLSDTTALMETPQPQSTPAKVHKAACGLHEAKAKLLAKHAQMPVAGKAEAPQVSSPDVLDKARAQVLAKLVPVMLVDPKKKARNPFRNAVAQDPRIRPAVVAPTGGA